MSDPCYSVISSLEIHPSRLNKEAIILAQAGAPGKRKMLPNARHMIHQPSGGARGQATDIQIQAEEILKMKKNLTEIYAKHNSAGKTYEQLVSDMERDKFMSAEEAKAYGLVDQVVSSRS